jgi:hypothetical protein
VLLLPIGFNQQRIAKIIVVKMKCRLVVPVSIGLDDLPIRNFCILNKHIYVRAAFSICPTDKPFDRKPMVRFMCCENDRWETAQHDGNGNDPSPPSRLTLHNLSPPHVLRAEPFPAAKCLSRLTQQNVMIANAPS